MSVEKISDEELHRRKEFFRNKYTISKHLSGNGIWAALGNEFVKQQGWLPPHADHYSYWKNKDGHLIIRLEPYSSSLWQEARQELEAWCEKYEFECIYDQELLPFHDAEGIEVIVLVSKIKYRNARECKKRGWIE